MNDVTSFGLGLPESLIVASLIVFFMASMWRVYTKAGQPGWSIFIPIYNLYVLLRIAGKPGWWLLLMLIPGVNIIVEILMYIGIAKNFGKGGGYAVGLVFLPYLFLPMLAFGDAEYTDATGTLEPSPA